VAGDVITKQPRRVLATHSLRATRQSWRVVLVFVVVAILLMVGIAWKAWPIAVVEIKPTIAPIQGTTELNVDLDITEPSLATVTIPGRWLAIGKDRNQLAAEEFLVRVVDGHSIVFSAADLQAAVTASLMRLSAADSVILLKTVDINEGQWEAAVSGRSFHSSITATAQAYQDLPFKIWTSELAGISKDEAEEILRSKPGVDKVTIMFYPSFFPNPSQKLPREESAIRFTLDTD